MMENMIYQKKPSHNKMYKRKQEKFNAPIA
jgi:hypothetical protein